MQNIRTPFPGFSTRSHPHLFSFYLFSTKSNLLKIVFIQFDLTLSHDDLKAYTVAFRNGQPPLEIWNPAFVCKQPQQRSRNNEEKSQRNPDIKLIGPEKSDCLWNISWHMGQVSHWGLKIRIRIVNSLRPWLRDGQSSNGHVHFLMFKRNFIYLVIKQVIPNSLLFSVLVLQNV